VATEPLEVPAGTRRKPSAKLSAKSAAAAPPPAKASSAALANSMVRAMTARQEEHIAELKARVTSVRLEEHIANQKASVMKDQLKGRTVVQLKANATRDQQRGHTAELKARARVRQEGRTVVQLKANATRDQQRGHTAEPRARVTNVRLEEHIANQKMVSGRNADSMTDLQGVLAQRQRGRLLQGQHLQGHPQGQQPPGHPPQRLLPRRRRLKRAARCASTNSSLTAAYVLAGRLTHISRQAW